MTRGTTFRQWTGYGDRHTEEFGTIVSGDQPGSVCQQTERG